MVHNFGSILFQLNTLSCKNANIDIIKLDVIKFKANNGNCGIRSEDLHGAINLSLQLLILRSIHYCNIHLHIV